MCNFITLIITLFCIFKCKTTFIECSRTEPCYNQNITCSSNEDCTINCNDAVSCSFSTIVCPYNESNSCSVACNHTLSCTHTTIQAQHSSSLSITSNGYEPLSFSSIFCPHDACTITHNGDQIGLSMMDLYTTTNTHNNIHITCASINTCWSNSNNPVSHYGDSLYSKTCTFINTDYCQSDDGYVLIARHDIPSSTISSTANILEASVAVTDNVLYDIETNDLDESHIDNLAIGMLIFIAFIAGIIVSVCGFFLYERLERNPSRSLARSTITGASSSGHISPKRVIPKGQMSPTLRDLSPSLNSTNMELIDDIDFILNDNINAQTTRKISDEGNGDMISTAGTYGNSKKCDVSGINSPSSWMSFKDSSHLRTDTKDTNMSLSVCMETTTSGIKPDEFVVTGDKIISITPQ